MSRIVHSFQQAGNSNRQLSLTGVLTSLRSLFAFLKENECNREWVLKKSVLLKTTKIVGIENVYPRRERRL
jgi:hypothetical protein